MSTFARLHQSAKRETWRYGRTNIREDDCKLVKNITNHSYEMVLYTPTLKIFFNVNSVT